MNKLLIGGALVALVTAIGPAVAQPAPPTPPGVASGTAPVIAPVAPGVPQVRVITRSQKPMTRDEMIRHVRSMFERLDANKDGYLTRDELNSIHQRMAGMMAMPGKFRERFAGREFPLPDRAAMFDRLDTNHDGSISRQEYMAAQPQLHEKRVIVMRDGAAATVPGAPMPPAAPGAPGMRMPMHAMGGAGFAGRLFDMADTNHDGRVSLAEAQALALAHFDKADTNHDGRITPDEHRQMRHVRIEHRQQS